MKNNIYLKLVFINSLYFAICGLIFSYVFVNFNLIVYYILSIFAVVYYYYEKRKKRNKE